MMKKGKRTADKKRIVDSRHAVITDYSRLCESVRKAIDVYLASDESKIPGEYPLFSERYLKDADKEKSN